MYGIFTYICPKNHPNVGKYSIHGAYGYSSTTKISQLNAMDGALENPDSFGIAKLGQFARKGRTHFTSSNDGFKPEEISTLA